MSTTPLPGHYPAPSLPMLGGCLDPARAKYAVTPPTVLRRRANMEQGKALEILGHAIEYLADSRMFLYQETSTPGDGEAIHILMRLSRNVFAQCDEVVPAGRRLRRWLADNPLTRTN